MVYRKVIAIEKAALVGDECGIRKGTYRGDAGKLIKARKAAQLPLAA
jgi:hypothetical protein